MVRGLNTGPSRGSSEFMCSMFSPCHSTAMRLRAWLSLVFLSVIVVCTQATDEVVVKQIKPEQKELKCYKCLDYEPHCQSLANASAVGVAVCGPDETFCQVQRQHLNDGLLTFERRCASSCKPGCENAGEYQRCSSCCTDHLCNTDNSAPGFLRGQMTTATATFICLAFFGVH